MDRLHGHLPYGISFGNHDFVNREKVFPRRFFPLTRYSEMPWFGGSHDETNTCQLFTAEGIDFLIVHLDCNPTDDAVDWADKVMKQNTERRLIVTTHHYLGRLERHTPHQERWDAAAGRMNWSRYPDGNTPQQLWNKCLSRHRNLILVLSGDQGCKQSLRQVSTGIHGNIVHELECDYMVTTRSIPKKSSFSRPATHFRDGWLRLLRFLPHEKRLEVRTFSPLTERLCQGTEAWPDPELHCFSLDLNLGSESHAESAGT